MAEQWVDLTDPQRRTVEGLLAAGQGIPRPADLAARLRHRLDDALRPLAEHLGVLGRPLRLSKEPLNAAARCEGLFDAMLRGEARPFLHSVASAAGTVGHRAIELDVALEEALDPPALAKRSVESLARDRRFSPFWSEADAVIRADITMRAARAVEQFRASFPPIRDHRRTFAPVTELWLESRVGGGSVRLAGKVDLLLARAVPGRVTRVLLDLKSGRASRDHPEDMRLYALLYTLRCGVPPLRVATFFLTSGEWQPEDVDEPLLGHAADRVVGAVRVAAELASGRPPTLSPGRHCRWCPRRATCPVAQGVAA